MPLSHLASRISNKALAWTILGAERAIKRFSAVGDQAFLEPSKFPWHRRLEENHRVIRRELDALLGGAERIPAFQEISPDQEFLTQDDKWRTFFLYGYGHEVADNCATCPETARLLAGIPGMKTAMFSILSPHKEIPEHRGPYAGVLRYHLGLIIPDDENSCGIIVDGEKAQWSEGKSLFFDDTFAHRAWNNSDELRVVLFVDFERPVRRPFDVLNRSILGLISRSKFVSVGLENLGVTR